MYHSPIWFGWIKVIKMEKEKLQLLKEQVNILNSVIEVLQKDFTPDGVDDEINFLSIVSGNLKELAKSI